MKKITILIFNILLILVVILSSSGCTSADNLENKLFSKAKSKIKYNLKAPSTAEFSPRALQIRKSVEYTSEDPEACWDRFDLDEELPEKYKDYKETYEIMLYVDAQNSYGAMIRNFYTCQINSDFDIYCMDSDEWEPECYRKALEDY